MNKQYYFILLLILGCLPAAWGQNDLLLNWANALRHNNICGGAIYGSDIKRDASGNTYVTGSFQNTADFDPSAGVANLTSAGAWDIFLAKYDASGNYVYAKALGGFFWDQSAGLAVDVSGNVYITGYFSGTADFDPSAGVANLISAGGSNDIFLAKYNASGNYVYAKKIGGTSDDVGTAIAVDGNGNAYVTGYFSDTVDFDPSAGVANLSSAGIEDIFLAKYNSSGNYLYAKSLGGASSDSGSGIVVDGSGNAYITGSFFETVDFDPSAGVANLTSAGYKDIFFAKYNSSGNYVYAKSLGGADFDGGGGIAVDTNGNAYITGSFSETVDFDPSAGVANLISVGGSDDIFLAKYNASGNYVYAKSFGDEGSDWGSCVVVDGSGNAYITGGFQYTVDFDPSAGVANLRSAGWNDIFLAKFDAAGNYMYANALGGLQHDNGSGIAVDGSGNAYVTGGFCYIADFDPSAATANLISGGGQDNCFIGKYSSTGNYIWAKSLGGYDSLPDYAEGHGITRDALGNTYVVGIFTGTVDFDPSGEVANLVSFDGMYDIFFAKYDASGNYVFAKSFGGSGQQFGNSIAIDGSGNIYITGNFASTTDFDPSAGVANLSSSGQGDIFLAKYDVSGNYVYAKKLGGADHDEDRCIVVDASGNAYVTGFFSGTADFDPSAGVANLSSAGQRDIFLAKYDSSGNYVYAKKIGGASSDESHDIAIDTGGNAYITGYFQNTVDFDPSAGVANLVSAGDQDAFLAKYDTSGNYVYAISIGGTSSELGRGIAVDGNGNTYVTGFFRGEADFDPSAGVANLTSTGGYSDVFLAKYDSSGNYVYAKKIGGTYGVDSRDIAVDGSGNAYLTGSFAGTVDFDPSAGVANLKGSGWAEIFIAKYDGSGNYVYAKSMGGYGEDIGYSLAIDGVGNIYITGSFQNTADFDPSVSTYNLTTLHNKAIFVARYNETGTTMGVNDFVLNNLKLYPNPVTDIMNIENEQTISTVEVYSITGQRVLVKTVNAISASIDMSGLNEGMYLVKVVADDAVKAIKVIKK
ncbi:MULTISPECIES: SBBP repeat-containing protein [Flavobacterium]|uniref:SBBP repeat-containing protein n=1 Tax=Flavobacterium TaxID=237 RepID=UPI001FCBA391|nr:MULTISPECIES: SBBP repeat-containing protein [Flavobacterium]UOK43900.1 SBBP repeat-containing protein [Flavobacterium enshiense]